MVIYWENYGPISHIHWPAWINSQSYIGSSLFQIFDGAQWDFLAIMYRTIDLTFKAVRKPFYIDIKGSMLDFWIRIYVLSNFGNLKNVLIWLSDLFLCDDWWINLLAPVLRKTFYWEFKFSLRLASYPIDHKCWTYNICIL